MEDNMQWEKPKFVVLNMSAEIGAYQDDFERDQNDPVARARAESTATRPVKRPQRDRVR
jgi:hypothetical protein